MQHKAPVPCPSQRVRTGCVLLLGSRKTSRNLRFHLYTSKIKKRFESLRRGVLKISARERERCSRIPSPILFLGQLSSQLHALNGLCRRVYWSAHEDFRPKLVQEISLCSHVLLRNAVVRLSRRARIRRVGVVAGIYAQMGQAGLFDSPCSIRGLLVRYRAHCIMRHSTP